MMIVKIIKLRVFDKAANPSDLVIMMIIMMIKGGRSSFLSFPEYTFAIFFLSVFFMLYYLLTFFSASCYVFPFLSIFPLAIIFHRFS
jgi:hypothetical protein